MNDQQTVELTVAYDASGDSRTLKQSVGGASAEDLGGALSANSNAAEFYRAVANYIGQQSVNGFKVIYTDTEEG
jgi:hypothetical protein